MRLIFNFGFILSREFGCLRLFHDVSYCSGSFCVDSSCWSIEVLSRFCLLYFFVMDSFLNLNSLCCVTVLWSFLITTFKNSVALFSNSREREEPRPLSNVLASHRRCDPRC